MVITADDTRPRTSWRPMIGLFCAQVLMSFNVAALPVSIGGMVDEFGVPPTTVSTAIVMYGLAVGWRPVFAILLVLAIVVFALTFTFRADKGNRAVTVDIVGAALIGAAVVCLTLGFNNLNGWGLVAARPGAPFDISGLSPAPLMIVGGIVLGQTFFVWTRRRAEAGEVPLVNLSSSDRPGNVLRSMRCS